MSTPEIRESRNTRWVLVASVALTALLYLIPFGRVIAYPLVLISTVAHELGHGIAAMLVGGTFTRLVINTDASGTAFFVLDGSLSLAFAAAGGLLGPAIVAYLCFHFGQRPGPARGLLGFFAVTLIAVLIFVDTWQSTGSLFQSWFGPLFIALLSLTLLGIVTYGSPILCQFATLFLGAQLALSVFSRGDYLFTQYFVNIAGRSVPSDTQNMAEHLFLPYWFWGLVCGGFSIAILIVGTRPYWPTRSSAPADSRES